MKIQKDITNLDLMNYLYDDIVESNKFTLSTLKLARKIIFEDMNLDTYDDFYLFVHKNDFLILLSTIQEQILNYINSPELEELIENEFREMIILPIPDNFFVNLQDRIAQKYPDNQENLLLRASCLEYQFDILNRADEQISLLTENSNYKIYVEYLLAMRTTDDKLAIEDLSFMEDQYEEILRLKKIAIIGKDRNLSEMVTFKESFKKLFVIPPGIIRSLPQGIQMIIILNILNRAKRVTNYFLQPLLAKKELLEKQDS